MHPYAAPKKRYQEIADAVAKAIADGRYLPGHKLPSERELTEEFNVSRPTIREAMIALEIRGIVEMRRNSGVYAAKKTPPPGQAAADLDVGAFDLAEARRLIEGEAAALAARTINDQECDDLYALIEKMRTAPANDVSGEAAEREFHVGIARATRNAALVFVIEALWQFRQSSPLTRDIWRRAREAGISAFIDDHIAIADSIRARDPDRARKTMLTHVTNVINGLLVATENEEIEQARERHNRRRSELIQRSLL